MIAIIIPIHNGLEYTKVCLQNLQKLFIQAKISNHYKIIIIDDGSTDGSADWIHKHFPEIHIVKGNGNLWWSGGVNRGIECALKQKTFSHVLLWNNDVTSSPEYFTLLRKLANNSSIDTIWGSKVMYKGQEEKIWSMGGYFNPSNGKKDMYGRTKHDHADYKKIFQVDWLPGMGTLIPVSAFNKIGLFDEKRFPQYHGDSDFSLRAGKNGLEIKVHPELIIYNDKSQGGLMHDNSFKKLWQSLKSIKSGYCFRKDVLFYRLHADSLWAYKELIKKYGRFIGGFIKWKILGLTGLKRKKYRI